MAAVGVDVGTDQWGLGAGLEPWGRSLSPGGRTSGLRARPVVHGRSLVCGGGARPLGAVPGPGDVV